MKKTIATMLVLSLFVAFFVSAPYFFGGATPAMEAGSSLFKKTDIPLNLEVIWNRSDSAELFHTVTLLETELAVHGWQKADALYDGEYVAGYCAIDVRVTSRDGIQQQDELSDEDPYELTCFAGTIWKNTLLTGKMRMRYPEDVIHQVDQFLEKLETSKRWLKKTPIQS